MNNNAEFFDEDGQAGALKAGFLGFDKSGKTYTATLLMCAVREVLGLTGPLAMLDTESGSLYIKDVVMELTGQKLRVKRARNFQTLVEFGRQCEADGVAGAIVDSVTHLWRELCDSYLRQLNEIRERKGWKPLAKLEAHHWGAIKQEWSKWTDFYLTSPLSIAICGRAGFEFDNETTEEGRRELVRTGVKMKGEGETGYEPSLLVYMDVETNVVDREQGKPVLYRTATVLGDRFRELDGQIKDFRSTGSIQRDYEAVRDFFMPHLAKLHGTHTPVDTKSRTYFSMTAAGDDNGTAERREREILCDEIQHLLVTKWPGQTAAEKKAKSDMIGQVFGRPSWTYVETLASGVLREGRERIAKMLSVQLPEPLPPADPKIDIGRTDGASDEIPEFAPPAQSPPSAGPTPPADESQAAQPTFGLEAPAPKRRGRPPKAKLEQGPAEPPALSDETMEAHKAAMMGLETAAAVDVAWAKISVQPMPVTQLAELSRVFMAKSAELRAQPKTDG